MKPVLVDTSVWVLHFRQSNQALVKLLEQDAVRMHPLILGELACGTPPERTHIGRTCHATTDSTSQSG